MIGACRCALPFYNFGVMFDFGFAKMFSGATFNTDFYDKDILIAATEFYKYYYLIILSPLTAILQLRNFVAS